MKQEIYGNHLLVNNLPDAFAELELILDDEGKPVDSIFLEVNSSFEKITALKREEIIGQKSAALLSAIDLDRPAIFETLARAALTGETVRFNYYSAQLDRDYEISAYGKSDRRYTVIFYDRTAQKRKEKQDGLLHREERKRLEMILSNTPAIIYLYRIKDGEKAISYINDNVGLPAQALGFKN